MSLNHLSDQTYPTPYLNLNVGGVKLFNNAITNYNSTNLNVYEEYEDTAVAMFDGATQVGTLFTVRIQRIGNYCNLFFDLNGTNFADSAGVPGEILQSNTGIVPPRFRPNAVGAGQVEGLCFCITNVTGYIGRFVLTTAGTLNIEANATGAAAWNATVNNIGGCNLFYKVA